MWRCIKIKSSLQGLAYKAWSMYRMSRSLIYLLKKIDDQIQYLSRVLKYKFGRGGGNFERSNF